MTIDRNDPRLTAYVLNELDAPERAEIEAAIQASPELAAEAEEIRRTASFLEGAFSSPDGLRLNEDQIGAIEAALQKDAMRTRRHNGIPWMKIAALLFLLVGIPVVIQRMGSAPTLDLAMENPEAAQVGEGLAVGDSPVEGFTAGSNSERKAGESDTAAEASSVVDDDRKVLVSKGFTKAEGRQAIPLNGRENNEIDKLAKPQISGEAQSASPVGPLASATTGDASRVPQNQPSHEVIIPVGSTQPGGKVEAPRMRLDALVVPAPVPAAGVIGGVPEYAVITARADRPADSLIRGGQPFHTEGYDRIVDNDFKKVLDNPLSTFSIDVDTASYANVRRFLTQGTLPPPDAVRIEELINYFNYEYPQPTGEHPFSVNLEAAAAPWAPEHRLLRIGLKGRELQGDRPPANLVFLIDVSGSMSPANKLPLLQQAMKLLVDQMRPQDRVAITVYAGASGLVLPSTTGSQKAQILESLDHLQAGGSTNGAAGIELAYSVALSNLIEGGINRVILATDGDFNVGVTDRGSLTRLIEEKAKQGVFLSVLGFGMGNLKDSQLEQLADKGNGNYGYVDTIREARKLLVEQLDSTLVTIAKDVKIQVEFNPAKVAAYRLIGYENRALANEDFNDDKKDAGEIGAGHTVTALYEIVPVGGTVATPGVDPLKYQQPARTLSEAAQSGELVTVKLRYKQPEGETSQLLSVPFTDAGQAWPAASRDFKFAASVAGFGMILRESPYKGNATFASVVELARESGTLDAQGYRREFLELVEAARRISGQ